MVNTVVKSSSHSFEAYPWPKKRTEGNSESVISLRLTRMGFERKLSIRFA